MLKSIDHIGVAVKDLDRVVGFYRDILGLEFLGVESVPSQKVRVAKFDINGVHIEFLEATHPDSPIAKFIAKRGEGLHHIAYRTDNIDAELEKLKNMGVKLINEKPVEGSGGMLIAFLHPSSSLVLTELVSGGRNE